MAKNYKQKYADLPDLSKYQGLSDFLLHAPQDEKMKVFTYAAQRANEDQMRIFQKAQSILTKSKDK